MSPPLAALAAVAALLALLPSAAATPAFLFGTVEFRTASLGALPQWQETLRAIEAERAAYDACARDSGSCASQGLVAWDEMIKSQSGRPKLEQIHAINRFLNDWRYRPDTDNYGRRDYWATPLEFLNNSGDCEDYAIAKYVTLRRLDFSPDDLRLVVVRDLVREIAHAVLAVYLDDRIYILDNLTSAVLPHEQVRHYAPYYSTNETARWAHVTPVAPVETIVAATPANEVAPSTEETRSAAMVSSP